MNVNHRYNTYCLQGRHEQASIHPRQGRKTDWRNESTLSCLMIQWDCWDYLLEYGWWVTWRSMDVSKAVVLPSAAWTMAYKSWHLEFASQLADNSTEKKSLLHHHHCLFCNLKGVGHRSCPGSEPGFWLGPPQHPSHLWSVGTHEGVWPTNPKLQHLHGTGQQQNIPEES